VAVRRAQMGDVERRHRVVGENHQRRAGIELRQTLGGPQRGQGALEAAQIQNARPARLCWKSVPVPMLQPVALHHVPTVKRSMNDYSIDPQTIVDFWRDLGPEGWFRKDDAVDATIRQRFGDVYERAARGELDEWAEEPNGALALVILLDQFPRNMFRGSSRMFATDDKALALARTALARGDHYGVGEDVNQFFAMPLMHSETLADQEDCVRWMEEIGEENVPYAIEHRDIIARFGRFPHRNAVLERASTPDEDRFLHEGGFAG